MIDRFEGYRRHVDRCRDATVPGDRLRLLLGDVPVGWLEPALAAELASAGLLDRTEVDALRTDTQRLDAAAAVLAARGRCRLRGERFDIRSDHDGGVVATLDRGALPCFGIAAVGVHLNGLVRRPGAEPLLWVARRAANKLLDPGKLDHLAAGGVPAGLDPWACLIKEAEEECGLAPALTATAQPVAVLRYAISRAEGLRRDTLHCYDVTLPPGWQPEARDGEVESFELWPLRRVAETVRDTDEFKFNVNLVLIDLFLRENVIDGTTTAGRELIEALRRQ